LCWYLCWTTAAAAAQESLSFLCCYFATRICLQEP
jgi:hypothetical protein